MPERFPASRRRFLRVFGAGLTATLAGCPGDAGEGATGTPPTTQTPHNRSTGTSTATVADRSPPKILDYGDDVREDGSVLFVKLAGRDDREIARAAISYAGETLEDAPGTPEVRLEGTLPGAARNVPVDGPQRIVYRLVDAAGRTTEKAVIPDATAPELSVRAHPTDTAGEIRLVLEGRDEIGLGRVSAAIGGDEVLQVGLTGSTGTTVDRRVTGEAVEPFAFNEVDLALSDWNGNRTRKSIESYARRYDVAEMPLDIGVDLVPLNLGQFEKCIRDDIDTGPAMVDYQKYRIPPQIVTRWIDQMQGHGIDRMILDYSENTPWNKTFRPFLESTLSDAVTIQAFYWLANDEWRNADSARKDVVHPTLDTLRTEIMERANAATYDGRPILTLGNASGLEGGVQYRRIMDEWGSYEAFIADWRDRLAVDGTDPFLVCGIAGFPGAYSDRLTTIAPAFDAITNWLTAGVWDTDAAGATWAETYEWAEAEFQAHREFAEEHDMEFIPRVFPGFDDRATTCNNRHRYIPRGPDHLAQLFELADRYRTTDMINVAVWNDFLEMTAIQPGTYRGTDYGTNYLEVIEAFQRSAHPEPV